MQLKGAAGNKRRVDLTNLNGLRGLGVIEVIIYHMGYTVMRHAWLCISIFFALSGLLITGITVEAFEKTGTVDVVRFWSRRVGRLFPALFVVIMLCALSRFIRLEDEAELWWERNDLLWAITFLSNYNLVSIRRDDYFAAMKPSLARHLWTLAIEEQYYLVWPVIYCICCKLFPRSQPTTMHGNVLEESGQPETEERTALVDQSKDSLEDVQADHPDRMRPLLLTLCAGELVVIFVSYLSSCITIKELGMSAAYYSTWSRMGDLACGGLMWLLVRLHPRVYRRYTQQPGLEPMTTPYRVWLEALWFLCLCLTVLPPMIQAPLADILPLYFYYFRLPFSFLICVFAVAGVLQISEPLPRWAIFSRFISSKPMVMLGIVSYGVYLNHWPLILFCGSPVDQHKFDKADGSAVGGGAADGPGKVGDGLVRDGLLLFFSLTSGLVSFQLYERPLLVLAARAQRPWTVIAAGAAAAAVTAAVVCGCYWDVPDPHGFNDALQVYGPGQELSKLAGHASPTLIPGVNVPLPGSSSVENEIATTKTSGGEDTHHTPMWLVTGVRSVVGLRDILDEASLPLQPIECTKGVLEGEVRAHGLLDITSDCFDAPATLTRQLAAVQAPRSVLVVCRTLTNEPPCRAGRWAEHTHWVWLSSVPVCGREKPSAADKQGWAKRCPQKLKIHELALPDVDEEKKEAEEEADAMEKGLVVAGSHHHRVETYTGRVGSDVLYLLQLVTAVDALLGPTVLNRKSMALVRAETESQQRKEQALEAGKEAKATWEGEVTVLVMGESIADRMGGIFKELLAVAAPCLASRRAQPFRRVKVVNLALSGQQCVNYFLPCTDAVPKRMKQKKGACSPQQADTRQRVEMAIPTVRPQVVLLHDDTWDGGWNRLPTEAMRTEALSNLVKQARSAGVAEVVFLTTSVVGDTQVAGAREKLAQLRSFLRATQCAEGDDGSVAFTVLRWHLLTCPAFADGQCPHRARGFADIMPDGRHPTGPAGMWLCAQALAAVVAAVAQHQLASLGYQDWSTARSNPVTSCLLEQEPAATDTPLEELTARHFVCPP